MQVHNANTLSSLVLTIQVQKLDPLVTILDLLPDGSFYDGCVPIIDVLS
jgi:hypothetical protein